MLKCSLRRLSRVKTVKRRSRSRSFSMEMRMIPILRRILLSQLRSHQKRK
jgi:hypothetical protein